MCFDYPKKNNNIAMLNATDSAVIRNQRKQVNRQIPEPNNKKLHTQPLCRFWVW